MHFCILFWLFDSWIDVFIILWLMIFMERREKLLLFTFGEFEYTVHVILELLLIQRALYRG